MMRDIYLYGAAGQLHGSHFRIDVASPAEAVRALIALRPGLRRTLRNGNWRVIVGPPRIRNAIGVDLLNMNAGHQPLHFVPATRPRGGGSGKGIGAIIVGVVLIGAAIILSGGTLAAPLAGLSATAFSVGGMGVAYSTIALLGVSMVLGGISAMLTQAPTPDAATDNAAPGDAPSFLFNGVTNNSQEGGPVPLVFGTHLVGSVVVNAGLNAEDIPTGESASAQPPSWWGDITGGGGKVSA
jgi:predicted phage tail protein